MGHRIRHASHRRRARARVQEPCRREADERHRPGRQAPQGQLHSGLGVVRQPHVAARANGPAEGRRTSPPTTSCWRPGRSRHASAPSRSTPRVMDSTGALDLPEIPKSLLVVGGGYIGLELGSVYAAFGTKVSVVEMTAGLLPGADRDLVRYLSQRVEKTFDKVLLSTKVTSPRARARASRSRSRARGAEVKPTFEHVLVVGWPTAERRRLPDSTKLAYRSTDRGFIRPTQRRTRNRRFSPSATSPASRCWRTRRRTKRASRSRPRRPQGSVRAAARFQPSSSPIPKSPGRD